MIMDQENDDFNYHIFYHELTASEEKEDRENKAILKTLGRRVEASFAELMDGCVLSGKIEWVEKPEGRRQNESIGIFQNIHVDQRCDGEDSYSGNIYARCRKKWLKIPYYC